jgi:adenosine deaminase
MKMDWTKLPKVELHLHLDCSLSYEVISRINPSITLDQYKKEFVAPDKDNMLYAEIRFAPLLHTKQGLSAFEVVSTVEAAVAEAVQNTGIEARLILCTLRYYSTEQSLETVKLVEQFRDTYVVGFDVAAETPGNVIDPHLPAFQYAREKDINFTAHVGETRGIQNVWDTLEHFAPSRVGHGVCSIGDPKLLEYLKSHHIHLEACPTSNVQTNCYDTYADHPIDKLYRAGISVSVNTDTRTISNITLSQEYKKLHETFGWGIEDFHKANRYALKSAFLSEDVQKTLLERLDSGYQQSF